MSTTPRRPLVPSPTPREVTTPGGIAGRAIAARENTQRAAPLPQATNGGQQVAVASREGPFFRSPVGHIAGAIAAVMSKVDTIEKRGKNEYFGYMYARMEDVLYAVTPLMGAAGLAVIQNEVQKEVLEGSRLAVTYEFSIFHSSGEVWPEKPRFTGVSLARDRKGNWDDKAVNKCHTTARKYFLLSLFQVPAGDFPDADEDDANQRQEKAPVPGPSQRPADEAPAQTDPANGPPHAIKLGPGKGPVEWGQTFIRAIGKAQSVDEVKAWDAANEQTLQGISDQFAGTYDAIQVAVARRLTELSAASGMPDPSDPTAAMNWVAAQLQDFLEYDAGEAFWNQVVAPREREFSPPDWDMLLQEWQRFETRFPQQEDTETPGG